MSVSGGYLRGDKTVFCLRAPLLMRGGEFVFSNPSLLKLSKSFYFVWMRELLRARNGEIILAVKSSGRALSFKTTFKAIAKSKVWDNLDLNNIDRWMLRILSLLIKYKIVLNNTVNLPSLWKWGEEKKTVNEEEKASQNNGKEIDLVLKILQLQIRPYISLCRGVKIV